MAIRFRKPRKRETEALDRINRERLENADSVTPEQQIGAARVMGAIGMALVFGFFLTIAYSVYENSKTIAVQGTVTHVSSDTSTSGTLGNKTRYTSYGHVFQFVDKDGVQRTGSDGGKRQSRYAVGDVVAIGYYPDDPARIRIHSWFGLWKVQLVLLGLGAFLIWYMRVAIKQVKAGMP